MTAKAPAKGHPAKHSPAKKHPAGKPSSKHAAHVAHLKHLHHLHMEHLAHIGAPVTAVAKPAKPAKPAGFALDGLPVCVSEALAMSLRLAGGAVSDEDVLTLHCRASGAEDAPASIQEGLEAAFRFGLAGCRPAIWSRREDLVGVLEPVAQAKDRVVGDDLVVDLVAAVPRARASHGLILRIDHPGSHAVLATPDGWWSWGELHSPWPARVCEAWSVSWS